MFFLHILYYTAVFGRLICLNEIYFVPLHVNWVEYVRVFEIHQNKYKQF